MYVYIYIYIYIYSNWSPSLKVSKTLLNQAKRPAGPGWYTRHQIRLKTSLHWLKTLSFQMSKMGSHMTGCLNEVVSPFKAGLPIIGGRTTDEKRVKYTLVIHSARTHTHTNTRNVFCQRPPVAALKHYLILASFSRVVLTLSLTVLLY